MRMQSLASGLAGGVGAILLLIGLVISYVRVSVLSTPGFTARMETVRTERATRELLAGLIVRQVETRGRPDLVAARPLLEQAVASAIPSRRHRRPQKQQRQRGQQNRERPQLLREHEEARAAARPDLDEGAAQVDRNLRRNGRRVGLECVDDEHAEIGKIQE